MPSAANGKSEKAASSEATDNSPVRQIMTIIEHKIRNLEKRKSKLTSYRDLQKAGKELNADQKIAVAKYDEVVQTLEFARDLSKQVTSVATAAEREAKKQAKREAWVRYAADTNKIREVLLILDCLTQMGCSEAREHFLNGTNGAAKLTEEDLKTLDDLYPEVTPKHEANEEGQPAFHTHVTKAAEHLYAIIDGKHKELFGSTYAHVKEVITAIHDCGYFDKTPDVASEVVEENCAVATEEEPLEPVDEQVESAVAPTFHPHVPLPVAPAPAVVPAPGYPLRPLPPITLQEVEHAYFSQQYPHPRPIAEVIGSQNFYFLQESEIDSPVGTPQPPPILNQSSPPAIPTQTFTNPHFVQLPRVEAGAIPLPQHYAHPEHGVFPAVPLPPPEHAPVHHTIPPPPHHEPQIVNQPKESTVTTPTETHQPDGTNDEWKGRSPDRDDTTDRKTQGQGDGQNRYRRYGRGPRPANGYRGRGAFQLRHGNDYHGRPKDSYQNRQYSDNYQSRHKNQSNEGYYGNGDSGDSQGNENGGRYCDGNSYGGFKSRGRGTGRGSARGAGRGRAHYPRKENPE